MRKPCIARAEGITRVERYRHLPEAVVAGGAGIVRVSKADGSQSLDLQRDALIAAGVDARQIYSDRASGKKR